MIDQKQVKKIYNQYFSIIDEFFSPIKRHLGDDDRNHINLGIDMASYPLISDLILDSIQDLGTEIDKLWSQHAKSIFEYIKEQDSLKCIYSGDLSPVNLERFIKKSGLYIDTVIIPDPIYNLELFQKQIAFDKKYYLNKLIRHVFNIWKMKELVLSDSERNIIMILPINLELVNDSDKDVLLNNASTKFNNYIDEIFAQQISMQDDPLIYLENYDDPKLLYASIKNTNVLPNILKEEHKFKDFLVDFCDTSKYVKQDPKSMGWNFGLYLKSQFIRVQEHKFFCERLVAEPIYDYELPWFFFNYEMGGADIDTAIANALQKEQFEWLGNIPISALKILREENELEYMRGVLRKGITSLKVKKDTDLARTAKQLEHNFAEAFKQQKSELKKIEKKVSNITKKDIPIIVVTSLVGLIPDPSISIPVSLLSAGRDIKNALKQKKEMEEQMVQKENNFINLLIQSHEKK